MDGEQHAENPHYLHHRQNTLVENIREVVFGVQDGMVSTLGAITGIALGSGSTGTVILAGIAIISVESVSMAIGSYVANHSSSKLTERVLKEEREEIATCIECEQGEAKDLFVRDGWPEALAVKMAEAAALEPRLMLREMAYRELGVNPHESGNSVQNGLAMFAAYIFGGLVPLAPYFFLPITLAMPLSIPTTLLGLFALGVVVARYTAQKWYASGLRLFVFGGIALAIGFLVGTFVTVQ